MDKNPRQVFSEVLIKLRNEFSSKNPNMVICSKPFIKMEFLKNLIESCEHNVIFLDFDLLYSGYVEAKMIKKNWNVEILRSDMLVFENHIKEIIEFISKKQALVILDSFNVINNSFESEDSFRFINASIMLLSSIAKNTKSQILVTGIGIKNENGKWILSPGGKQLIEAKNSKIYYVSL